jgi:hypothetical protein
LYDPGSETSSRPNQGLNLVRDLYYLTQPPAHVHHERAMMSIHTAPRIGDDVDPRAQASAWNAQIMTGERNEEMQRLQAQVKLVRRNRNKECLAREAAK